MNYDENKFYREATRIILGTLDFSKALEQTLHFLKEFMPVDFIQFMLYKKDLGTMVSLASAGHIENYPPTRAVSLPPFLRDFVDDVLSKREPIVVIENDPSQSPIFKNNPQMLEYYPNYLDGRLSRMSLPLVIEGEHVAQLALVAKGLHQYQKDHAALFKTLNEPFAIAAANSLSIEKILRLQAMLEDDNRFLQQELLRISGTTIIGEEFGLRDIMAQVKQVAPQTTPVLLLGETGTGKDVIASALHYSSKRSDKPFINVNCGAIPESLIDSELFGHVRGAFTGAVKEKRGRFERANQGTIFLDEVGELPLEAQVRLLRVLQHKEFERVGGEETLELDVRIIAATNANLEDMVKRGRFREDVWYRLNVFPIFIPPLRQRKEDIPSLLHYFLEKKAAELKIASIPMLSKHSMDALLNHNWPGNVRELENLVERAMIRFREGTLHFEHMLLPVIHRRPTALSANNDEPLTFDEMSRCHIQDVLAQTKGKITGNGGAAEILDLKPSTLRSKMRKLGIVFSRSGRK